MPERLGPWDPLDLTVAIDLFAAANFRWWVTGGHALELFAGRSWRSHADTDISFCRHNADQLHELLAGWDIHVAAAGHLTPWHGQPLRSENDQDNLWCRQAPSDPWSLDLTISDGDDEHWIYRPNPSLRVPWKNAVLQTSAGVPYLAPELQLLFKSQDHRPKDDTDLVEILPTLGAEQAALLSEHLGRNHPWHADLTAQRER